MTDTREFDLLVFGATGFTGQFVALEIARNYATQHSLKWAIAGRSESKLIKLQQWMKEEEPKVSDIPKVIADVNDEKTMKAMCRRTKVLLNCTGPYRYYGEKCVAACIATNTHYLDITGEPEFIEKVRLKYQEEALANNVLVITACGFDSIPSDMGAVFNTEQYPKGGCASSIEAFISINGKRGHYTTYECIVLALSNMSTLKKIRASQPKVLIPFIGPRLPRRTIGYEPRTQSYFIPFMGSDASIVKNSQKYLVEHKVANVTPVQFGVYLEAPNIFKLASFILFGVILKVFTSFSFGQKLLLKYPALFTAGAFTHEGPNQKERDEATFSVKFFSKGYRNKEDALAGKKTPDWEVVSQVSGGEPGYVATPIFLIESALCVLKGEVPASGGVITTASAFRGTSLISNLQKRGIEFQVLKNEAISA